MTSLPLPVVAEMVGGRLRVDASDAPTHPAWEEAVDVADHALAAVLERASDVVSPGAITLAHVAQPEAATAYALIVSGRPDLACHRRERIMHWLEEALACYRADLYAEHGRLIGLRVVDSESHHGAWRPVQVTARDGSTWILKRRPGDGDGLVTGPGGLFERIQRAAAGRIQLPRVDTRRSTHGEGYVWQRWLDPAPTDDRVGFTATAIPAGEAPDTWHRVGAMAGACAALGITDLGEDNVVTHLGEHGLELVPVDTECLLDPGVGLHRTTLTRHPDRDLAHHVGIEDRAYPCTGGGPWLLLQPDGSLAPRERSCLRVESRSVLVDEDGAVGYAAHLTDFLRGITDAWVAAVQIRDELADTLRPTHRTLLRRVLPRSTGDYVSVLATWLTGGLDDPTRALTAPRTTPLEAQQLRRGDVPHLCGPIDDTVVDTWLDRLTLGALGPVLRDAVTHVHHDLPRLVVDQARGVSVHLSPDGGAGTVAVTLPGYDRLAVYEWHGDRVRLELPRAGDRRARPELRERLLRLQQADATLRHRWSAGGFAQDTAEAARLRLLTDAATRWLAEVLCEHGWLGDDLVGEDGAAAAADLAQHLEDEVVRHQAEQLIIAAALRGRARWTDVAGVVDAHAVLSGRPQVFGTKFREGVDGLEPCPLADPEHVDQVRRGVGLPPLETYAEMLAHHFTTGTPR